jgi:hypothetical protein
MLESATLKVVPAVPDQTPVLVVASLTVEGGAEEYAIRTVQKEMRGRIYFLRNSTCHLTVGEETYRLDFGINGAAEKRAEKLVSQTVVVTGKLESRPTAFGTTEQVLVVEDLRAAGWW